MLTIKTIGFKHTSGRLKYGGGRLRASEVFRWAEIKLTGQLIKVEQNQTAGDITETALANLSSKQEDCRVYEGLVSMNMTERDPMTS